MLSKILTLGGQKQFQVIEINADVGCVACQDRVSKIVSKMTGELSTLPPKIISLNSQATCYL